MNHPTGFQVVIANIVIHDSHLLLGKRSATASYPGTWGDPGGKLEHGETFEQASLRELWEETGLYADGAWHLDTILQSENHRVMIFMQPWEVWGELVNRIPDKCDGWEWFPLHHLPRPLLGSLNSFIRKWLAKPGSTHGDFALPARCPRPWCGSNSFAHHVCLSCGRTNPIAKEPTE